MWLEGKRIDGNEGNGMRTKNRQMNPTMLTIIRGRDKVRHVFQQLKGVMKEERKMTSGRISVRLNRRN